MSGMEAEAENSAGESGSSELRAAGKSRKSPTKDAKGRVLSQLSRILAQSKIGYAERGYLVRAFRLGSPHWKLLDTFDLPASPAATHDPFLLALRTLVRRDFGELSARHRWTAEEARRQPFGIQSLALEEAAKVPGDRERPPIFGISKALVDVGDFLPPISLKAGAEGSHDLRARFFCNVARCQLYFGIEPGGGFVSVAESLVQWGTGDSELRIFLEETHISVLETEGRIRKAAERYHSLLKKPELAHLVADRRAELLVSFAQLIRRHESLGNRRLRSTLKLAESILKEVPAHLNQPLRRQLAELYR